MAQPGRQHLLQLDECPQGCLLDTGDTDACRGTQPDGNRDDLFVIKQQWWHGRTATKSVSAAHPRRCLDWIAEVAEPLDIGPNSPRAYLETRGEIASGPVAARLQHCEQPKQARRCLPHDWSSLFEIEEQSLPRLSLTWLT
jgi:hypothetical protein